MSDFRSPRLSLVVLALISKSQTLNIMAKDWLEGIEDEYDVVVVGSGLGGLTGANYLAKNGHLSLIHISEPTRRM